MKLSVCVLAGALAQSDRANVEREMAIREMKPDRVGSVRYVYDHPLCDSIEECVAKDEKRCDGRTITEEKGDLSHRRYADRFSCRWEIVAPHGKKIGLKFWSDFDLEYDDDCSFDRLHLRCMDEDKIGNRADYQAPNGAPLSRFCGPKSPYNFKNAYDAIWPWLVDRKANGELNAEKYPPAWRLQQKKRYFQTSSSTDCKHLVIALDTDQDTSGLTTKSGFTVSWYFHEDNSGQKSEIEILSGYIIAGSKRAANKSADERFKAHIAGLDSSKPSYDGKVKKADAKYDGKRVKSHAHIEKYMGKMMERVKKCGKGFATKISDDLTTQIKSPKSQASGSPALWFKLWNSFAVELLTGDGVDCGWYKRSEKDNDVDKLDDSSIPCRTRRVFLAMQGLVKDEFGEERQCDRGAFDTFEL